MCPIVTQVLSLQVLGNCMVESATRNSAVLASQGPSSTGALATIAGLLRSPQPLLVEKAATLFTNLCGQTQLRQQVPPQCLWMPIP